MVWSSFPDSLTLHQHGPNAENDAAKAADGVTTSLEMEVGTADIDRWYAAREGQERVNYGVSVGHIPVRMAVMNNPGTFLPSGDAAHSAATPEEMEAIKYGSKRGALGVGAGSAYTIAATNWELVEVFCVATRAGATVHFHIRSLPTEREGNFVGFEEAMAAAAATGAPLHVVHIQSTSGPNLAHELQMIQEARARDMDVTTECYPYDHGRTGIESAIFDGKENEPDSYYAALLWPATGEHLTRETFLKYRKTGGMVILPSNTEENVHLAVVSPLTMIASDGSLQDGKGHPRTAGTHSLVPGRYVREQNALALMTALRKMTLMPAQRMEMRAPISETKAEVA
jgi:hypothetical protein